MYLLYKFNFYVNSLLLSIVKHSVWTFKRFRSYSLVWIIVKWILLFTTTFITQIRFRYQVRFNDFRAEKELTRTVTPGIHLTHARNLWSGTHLSCR